MATVWFSGVCDSVLSKVYTWHKVYEQGEVCKDQDYLNVDGVVVKKPTMYAHRIGWTQPELEHLIRIVKDLRPQDPILGEVTRLRALWRHGKLVYGGNRILTLAFYKEHVKLLLDILQEAKTGQTAAKIDQVIEQRRKEGKDLFQM
jgi:hypothetical protein